MTILTSYCSIESTEKKLELEFMVCDQNHPLFA